MIYLENLTKAYYKSGEVAKMLGVTTRTVQNYCINHKLNEIIINNRRLIPKESLVDYLDNVGLLVRTENSKHDVIYARVSTHKQKSRGDLSRQVEDVERYVVYQNPMNLIVIADVGSGLNDTRPKLEKLLLDNSISSKRIMKILSFFTKNIGS